MSESAEARERRRAYRVTDPDPGGETFRTELIVGTETFAPDSLVDINSRGANLEFDGAMPLRLAPGAAVRFQVYCAGGPQPVDIAAEVIFVGANGARRMLRLAFTQPGAVAAAFDSRLLEVFNRRVRRRRSPQEMVGEFAATVLPARAAEGPRLPVTVRNITDGGLGIAADATADAALRTLDSVRIFLRPREAERMIVATICYRAEVRGSVVYGCRFDWGSSSDAVPLMEELAAFRWKDERAVAL